MTKEQIEAQFKDKIPAIEKLLVSGNMLVRASQKGPGLIEFTKDDKPMVLNAAQVKGLETYLSMVLIMKVDELKTTSPEEDSSGG